MPPESFYTDYQKILLKNILLFSKRVQRIYNRAIVEASLSAVSVAGEDATFTLDKHPGLRKRIDEVLREMQKEILKTIIQATREMWDLSNQKNDTIVKTVLGGSATADMMYLNIDGYNAFKLRQEAGLNLSMRIWKIVKPFRHELEAGLADGIKNGRSAASMATDMKRYLNEPDKIFRRVRDENGKLQLSRAAKRYHPGQGIYRSSYKNALRLTRTEINMSNRTADITRWRQLPFVIGFRINLSNNHPKYDICDELNGVYPKTFNWPGGWHTQCLCYLTPELVSDEQADQMEDQILGIGKGPKIKMVKDVPKQFKTYVRQNKKRIAGWKNKPYWMEQNQGVIRKIVRG